MHTALRKKPTTAFRPKLSGLIGNGQVDKVSDILWAKKALHTLQRYDDPGKRHGFIDKELDVAIQLFQRDHDLKSDGILKPGGETERALHRDLVSQGTAATSKFNNPGTAKQGKSGRATGKTADFRLSDRTGNGQVNEVSDILSLKNALHTLGRYNDTRERHGFIDKNLDDAIQLFQRDKDLKSDGLLKPDGDTEHALRLDLKQLAAGKPTKTPKGSPPEEQSNAKQETTSPRKTEAKLPLLTMPDER